MFTLYQPCLLLFTDMHYRLASTHVGAGRVLIFFLFGSLPLIIYILNYAFPLKIWLLSFLELNSTPLCSYTSFIICSSVERLIGWICSLDIVNKTVTFSFFSLSEKAHWAHQAGLNSVSSWRWRWIDLPASTSQCWDYRVMAWNKA